MRRRHLSPIKGKPCLSQALHCQAACLELCVRAPGLPGLQQPQARSLPADRQMPVPALGCLQTAPQPFPSRVSRAPAP